MPDIVIACLDCTKDFKHTERSQAFFAEKGWTNLPKRCRPCREARKRGAGGAAVAVVRTAPQLHAAKCSECGGEALVPFKPDPERPVFCSGCHRPPQRTPAQ